MDGHACMQMEVRKIIVMEHKQELSKLNKTITKWEQRFAMMEIPMMEMDVALFNNLNIQTLIIATKYLKEPLHNA